MLTTWTVPCRAFPELLVSLRIFEPNPTMTNVPRGKHSQLMAIRMSVHGFPGRATGPWHCVLILIAVVIALSASEVRVQTPDPQRPGPAPDPEGSKLESISGRELGEESPPTSHTSQPSCDRLWVKPYACADAERRDPACLRLLENRDSRDGQHTGEFVSCQSTADSLDSVRQ